LAIGVNQTSFGLQRSRYTTHMVTFTDLCSDSHRLSISNRTAKRSVALPLPR
jgi:hypothetical protein